MKRARTYLSRRAKLGIIAGALILCAAVTLLFISLPDYRYAIRDCRMSVGPTVMDRNGELLRVFPDENEHVCLWTEIEQIPDCVKDAFVAAEDRRFFHHPGFDPVAIVRALYTNIKKGEIVSGASTITQQAVRLIRPRPRTYRAKVMELLEGVKMEAQLSKQEILELHLNLSPMGGPIRGVGLASLIYFGKDIGKVNPAEAAILAVLPRSPSRYDPRRQSGRKQVLAEKDRVLERMADTGRLNPGQLAAYRASDFRFHIRDLPFSAPHFVDFVTAQPEARGPKIGTTLDGSLQAAIDRIVKSHGERLAKMGISQAGALVVSVEDSEIRAMVGSLEYGPRALGYNNAVLAERGAGSTLKPFLYVLAFENGYSAFSQVPDTFRSYPSPHGDYMPLNADRRSYGPVTVRSALGNSLNISAVKTIKALGVDEFYRLLKKLELAGGSDAPAEHYGLGMAVGNVDVTLLGLTRAYAAIARLGMYRPLECLKGAAGRSSRVLSPQSAYIVSHILADASARLLTFGNPEYLDFDFPVAVKTGTSSNYRDCWMIGYTPQRVIGVWAGNFDGRPSNAATGARACGPIVADILRHLYGSGSPGWFTKPDGVTEARVCWMSGRLASPRCPYTSREVFMGDPSHFGVCDLEHTASEFYYLGAPYARWLHNRRFESGTGRFRLDRDAGEPATRRLSGGRAEVGGTVGRGSYARVQIVNPHDDDRFIVSSRAESRIRFQALVGAPVPYIRWLMNGVETARTPPPYEFFWTPTRGRHTVHAVTPNREADRITIVVE